MFTWDDTCPVGWSEKAEAAVGDRVDVITQQNMPASDQTATGVPGMRFRSRLVAWQEASSTGAVHAWCNQIVRLRWWAVRRRSGSTEASAWSRQTHHATVSYSSLDDKKRKLEWIFWQLRLSVNEQLDAVVEVGNIRIGREQRRVQIVRR